MNSTHETVKAFYDSFNAKDFEAMRGLLHDDLSFHGPMAVIDNANGFVAALVGFSQQTKEIEVKHLFVDGERACCVYDLVMEGANRRPVAEYFEVSGGLVGTIRSHFDARQPT